jgi:glucose-1-phosphate thymidylyltransferase
MVAKKVNDEMLILAGDNLFSFQLDGLLGYYKKHKTAVTALFDVGNPELAKRYGVAELNGDRILNFVEKPEKPSSTLVGVGIYVFPRKVTGILEEYVGTNPKSDNLGDFLSYLCQNEEVRGYTFDNGNWYDVGNPDSYIDAFKIFMEHSLSEKANIDSLSKIIQPVTIETGTKIIGRSIIGPFAYIGKNCVIENSDVSDTVVFDEVVLRKVKMWRSIVDECCEIRNLELNSSIIGGHAKIQRGE